MFFQPKGAESLGESAGVGFLIVHWIILLSSTVQEIIVGQGGIEPPDSSAEFTVHSLLPVGPGLMAPG